jgi:hypothetical protein
VHLRQPLPPDDGSGTGGSAGPAPERVDFVVPTRVIVVKFVITALLLLLALFGPNDVGRWLGLIAAVGVAIYAVRDLVARHRLHADADGIVAVRGYAGRRHLNWGQVERLAVDSRNRFGGRSELLELDAGEEIFQFSRYDLGVAPDEALAALQAVRRS